MIADDAPEFATPLEFTTDPMGVFQRRWKFGLAALILASSAALAAAQFMIHEDFEAQARVLVSTPRFSEEFVPSLEAGNPFEKMGALVGEILARDKLDDLVQAHGLYPNLVDSVPMGDLLAQMRDGVSVFQDAASRPVQGRSRGEDSAVIFNVVFAYPDSKKAAAVTNDIAEAFVESAIRLQTEQARIAADFLRRELAKAEETLEVHEKQITGLKLGSRGQLPEELDATLGRLDRLQSQRQSLALQVAQTETNLVTLAQQGATGAGGVPSPQVQLDMLRARLAEQRAVFTNDHPNVISLERQVAVLQREIATGAILPGSKAALVASAQKGLIELQSQLAAAEAEIIQLEAKVSATPAIAEKLAAMERKVVSLRTKHSELLAKVNDADLALSVETAQQGRRITVLERALPPQSPIRERRKYQAVGIVAAIVLAAIVMVLLELVDPVVISGRQVEQRFGVPILGSAPPIR